MPSQFPLTNISEIYMGQVGLQATLAASSQTPEIVSPHHPITCANGELRYEEDGTFSCEHASVPPNDARTRHVVQHSIALLILQLATGDECLSNGCDAINVNKNVGLPRAHPAS